jgi:ATP phosphoribosyltransferase regulatory subunit
VKISAALPTGVTALLFEAATARRRLETRLVGELEGAGFGEVILPIVDYLEPYEALLGAAGRRELYRFTDRDGEALLVRADFTPMLARLLAPRLPSLTPPLRLFYRGDVVRYAPARAGRQREHYQLGAELLGVPGAAAEAAMLRLFLRLLVAADAARPTLVLGFAGALDALLLAAGGDAAGELVAAVSRRDRAVARAASAALGAVVEDGIPADPAALGDGAGARLVALLALRDALASEFPGVRLEVDLAEFARDTRDPRLAQLNGGGAARRYYDGLVFRAWAGRGGEPFGGGGRYDGLFRTLGAELPAVGFSLSLDHLVAAGDTFSGDER